jgi:aspartyl-tRNA synthetase
MPSRRRMERLRSRCLEVRPLAWDAVCKGIGVGQVQARMHRSDGRRHVMWALGNGIGAG